MPHAPVPSPYLFPNLKRKHSYKRSLPDGAMGEIAIDLAHQRQ
jgi:hypothetical protein